ncbi:MAG: acyl-CoA dehydrogenase family protein [Hyphomicrobiaceae bacterium]
MGTSTDLFDLARARFTDWLEKLEAVVEETLIPNEDRLNDVDGVPDDLAQPLKDFGLFGLTIPARYGGLELPMTEQCKAMIAVTRASACYRARFSTTVGLSAQAILLNGTPDQCETYLPKLARGEWTSAFALTEEAAGSDATNVQTTARRDGNGYVLNGTKRYITNSNIADLFVVMARMDETRRGADGISAFLVERGTPGLFVGEVDPKMGQAGGPTAPMRFEDCRIPGSALLGGVEGQGFKNAMGGINTARLHVACTCVGQAERLTREALDYALTREQFGKPVAEHQLVGAMLADCRTETFAARAMIMDVAQRFTHPPSRELAADIACAKYFGSEMVCRVADRAVQVLGGQGYLRSHPIERLYRDVRLFRLFEGTSQIQQITIARSMIRGARKPS